AFALKAFEAGAFGYVTKGSAPEELIQAVAIVARGGRTMSADISRALAADRLAGEMQVLEDLGPREIEILRMLATGLSSEAVANALNLSHK
ncbi:LuxR C-terminal-related transcriptional regulator, partial [Acinetobacter baumannii]